MEYVLNEFSIDGQFDDVDEFVDSLQEVTLPVLKKLVDKDIHLLKSNDIYSCKVTLDKTFYEMLQSRKYPEITRIKGLLNKLFLDNPYWDYDCKCEEESIYKCDFTEKINKHCIAEALERDNPLLSFEHNTFKTDKIKIIKNGITSNVLNIYDKQSILEELLSSNSIKYNEYLCEKYKNISTFCVINNKDYFEEFILDNALSSEDVKNIIDDLEKLINRYNNNLGLGTLHKPIENYHEFRTILSNKRQIRIFYIMEGNNFVFLNCLLKKEQSTPESAKSKARSLIKEYKG